MSIGKKIVGLAIVVMVCGLALVAADKDNGNSLKDIWDAIFGVEEDVEDLSERMDLLEKIYALEARVSVLEECGECEQGPAGPPGPEGPQGPPGGLGEPDYDSGWRGLHAGYPAKFSHSLGTRDLFVYIVGRSSSGTTLQVHYGGDTYYSGATAIQRGAYWVASDDQYLQVYRLPDDLNWDEVRVLIWRLPLEPA